MTVRKSSVLRISQMVLLALAVMLTVACAMALADRNKSHRKITDLLERYTVTFRADSSEKDNDKEKNQSKGKPGGGKRSNETESLEDEKVKRICKRHVFSEDPPQNKLPNLTGVLGDEAFFDGEKGWKVGEIYNGAKIKEIGPDWVEIEFEGRVKKVYVFESENGGPSPPGPSRRLHITSSERRLTGQGGLPLRQRSEVRGVELTPEMIERFKNLSPEKRERALKHMPAELREKLAKAL
ncbi:MAG: hypothetical protein SVV80_09680 [Planctomycetota bacterium]|nr:hypothetical protein [Planctomycetota bacterium]